MFMMKKRVGGLACTDDLSEHVTVIVRENHCSTFSDLSTEFPEVSKATLFRIVTDTFGYCKLCIQLSLIHI